MRGLRLRTKVLIPVAVMILSVIVVALVVVNQVVRQQVLQTVSHELRKSVRIFHELQQREWDLLVERSWVIAEAPHLKAAVDTGDSTTVQHVAGEIFTSVGSEVLLILDRNGHILASLGLDSHDVQKITQQTVKSQNALDERVIVVSAGEQMYRLFSVPIVINDEISEVFLLGRVLVGHAIDGAYLEQIRNLVDCEVALLIDDHVMAATIPLSQQSDKTIATLQSQLTDAPESEPLHLMGEEYLAMRAGLQGEYQLFKSVDRAFKPIMQPIERTMVFVAGFAFLAAILISSFVSVGIVTPVEKLANAAENISAGDYELDIDVQSGDEIGKLASKFDEMRQALKQKMAQLNERNLELEDALTRLKEAQEELVRTERLAATGKITAQLSHELNNPIHNIRSCLEAARSKIAASAPGREFIDLAHDEVLRIGNLTRQMLDFYRPYVGSKQRIDLNQVIDDMLKSASSGQNNGKVRVHKMLATERCEVMASPDQLKQVFLNLYLNALDAMPDGGELTVSTYHAAEKICAAFEDTGCGISPENLDKIFDAFFTTKAQANGVGLGLSVSYGVVQSHSGNILVESELGKGTKFIVQLPGDANTKS